jgi:uncharacterized membrane protein YqjE
MAKSQSEQKDNLKVLLLELEKEYALCFEGLAKGKLGMLLAFLGTMGTMGGMLIAVWTASDKPFPITGTHLVLIVCILVFALVIYFSFVFGRAAVLRAEITKTKKMIELKAGEKVR